MSGVNVMTFAPLVDVLNGHPYGHHRNNLEALITSFTAMSKETGKPFLVNETFPGALDDLVRAEVVAFLFRNALGRWVWLDGLGDPRRESRRHAP